MKILTYDNISKKKETPSTVKRGITAARLEKLVLINGVVR